MWMRCHVQTSGVSLFREEPYNNVVRSAFHALAAVMGGLMLLVLTRADFDGSHGMATAAAVAKSGNVQAVAKGLFTTYLLPFEVASLILLVAMVGAILLAKKRL